MPWRLAKSVACPLVGDATATSSASSGIAFTAPAMQSAWKREPTMPTLTLDMAKGAKIPVGVEVGQGRSEVVTSTTSERHGPVKFVGMRSRLVALALLGLACRDVGSPPPPPPPPAPPPPLPARSVFPADNAWNRDISADSVDPNSDSLIARCGGSASLHPDFGTVYGGAPWGIPFITVAGTQQRVAITFAYADESDPGPYPIPPDAPIEGGASATGDRHVLVVDVDNWKLYELFDAHPVTGGAWTAGSGAIFDLASNALRPDGWTSADAAGLPIVPGLARYAEGAAGR